MNLKIRETKEEKLARLAQARAAEEQALKASYPHRLMTILERATNQNYELRVRDGAFELTDRDNPRDGTYTLPPSPTLHCEGALAELDWRLDLKEKAEREARRRVEVRNAALSKLSAEEREVLGL